VISQDSVRSKAFHSLFTQCSVPSRVWSLWEAPCPVSLWRGRRGEGLALLDPVVSSPSGVLNVLFRCRHCEVLKSMWLLTVNQVTCPRENSHLHFCFIKCQSVEEALFFTIPPPLRRETDGESDATERLLICLRSHSKLGAALGSMSPHCQSAARFTHPEPLCCLLLHGTSSTSGSQLPTCEMGGDSLLWDLNVEFRTK
jgi:hypothetical protein